MRWQERVLALTGGDEVAAQRLTSDTQRWIAGRSWGFVRAWNEAVADPECRLILFGSPPKVIPHTLHADLRTEPGPLEAVTDEAVCVSCSALDELTELHECPRCAASPPHLLGCRCEECVAYWRRIEAVTMADMRAWGDDFRLAGALDESRQAHIVIDAEPMPPDFLSPLGDPPTGGLGTTGGRKPTYLEPPEPPPSPGARLVAGLLVIACVALLVVLVLG